MHTSPGPQTPVEVRVTLPQTIRQECHRFWQGVVESFGVEWSRTDTLSRETSGTALLASPSERDASTVVLPHLLPPPLLAVHVAGSSHMNSPLQIDTTACPSPATPSSVSTARDDRGEFLTPMTPPCDTAASWHFALMPPWSLVEFDPKLWMLLRKNLTANLALTALTLTYMGLSRRLAATAPSPAAFASASSSSPLTSQAADMHASSTSSSFSFSGLLFFWWLRLSLWGLKYVGQWPFYTVLQIVGLVWYSQLYRETWLVRKRWVLRGTGLREASALSNGGPRAATASSSTTSTTTPAPTLPPLAAGFTRPWLAPIPLNHTPPVFGSVYGMARSPVLQLAVCLLHASAAYLRHTAQLVLRILLHKGPTAPLQEWVLGDPSAAAAAAARQVAASATKAAAAPSSPDVFESVVRHLEATSEVIFKALATMSFAFFASCVESVPVVGTPVCLLLNAQLYAFYVFDYRYATQQQPDAAHPRGSALLYQLYHFEQCWAYYAGYGIGSAVLSLWITHHVGVVVSVCAMSVLYSWQVVWSGFAVPLPSSRPLPLFSLWFYAVDTVQKQYAVLWRCACILALLYIPYQCVHYL